MSAHIVYPCLDPEYPATMSRPILTGLLRDQWNYGGVIITDGMDMHAIAGRYGAGQAAVRALDAGADMVMALGTRATQEETLDAIAQAMVCGALPLAAAARRRARLLALAERYPCVQGPYLDEETDRRCMAEGWRRSLSAHGAPRRPPPGARLRLVARRDVVSDGVSEAGVPADEIAACLGQLGELELVTFAEAEKFDWSLLPDDGRYTILASTSRLRYGAHARSWKPDLHLALWNPYHALDIDAPALMTYGFAAPALEAVRDWLAGRLEAMGAIPVPGFASEPAQP